VDQYHFMRFQHKTGGTTAGRKPVKGKLLGTSCFYPCFLDVTYFLRGPYPYPGIQGRAAIPSYLVIFQREITLRPSFHLSGTVIHSYVQTYNTWSYLK
jgi:hypothetical protein